jgi:hypothetical protein
MLNNITNELIQKYKTYYRGGGYYYADPKRTTPKDNGGVRWDTKLAYGNLDKDLEKYLLGTIDKGIVLSPIIKPYNKCFWGAIDVDGNVYKDDAAKLDILKKIKDLPLIPCLSKSNGLHLYLFLKEAATAKDLITVLNNLRQKLELPKGTELFPKQDGTKDKVGNGIMLPFMKGQKNTFVKVDNNDLFFIGSLQDFINEIESKIIDTDTFNNLSEVDEKKSNEHDLDKKYSITEIKQKIGKEELKGSLYDNWMTMLVAKLIAAGNTDEEIIENCLEHCTKTPDENLKWIKDKIERARKKWDRPSPDEARARFINNVIFIRKLEVYFNKDLNDVYGKEAINIEYSHLMPKKIKAASYFTDHPKKIIVENFQYRPELYNSSDIVFEIGGKKYINTYKPITIEAAKGNLELWEELLDYLFPDLETKTHMEDFISAHVQYPGKKIRHAPLIVSPHQRIGKGRMFAAIRKILGEDNTAEIDLTRALNQSKDYLTNKQLVLIDELKSESNWAEAQKLLNTLKRNITEEWHGSRFLYQDFKDVYSCTNYILFSNHTNALSINKNDERYWVVRCDVSPKQQIFYKHFSDWLKTPEAAQHLLWHYKNREISETFDFDGHAPRTIWSNQMSNEGKHPFIQRTIEDFDQNLMPFINDIVSIVDVRIHYKNVGIGKVRANEIHNALLEVGGKKLGQSKVSLLDREWFPTLYSIRNHEKYENVPVNQLGALYTPLFHPDTEKDL